MIETSLAPGATLAAPASDARSLPLQRGQLGGVVGVDDEDGEQARRLCGARVFANLVMRAGRLGPAFASVKHLHLAVIHLAADRPREHETSDERGAWVMMRRRRAARWIADDDADKALAGNVRYHLPEGRGDRLTGRILVYTTSSDWTRSGWISRKASPFETPPCSILKRSRRKTF
jgi:hypothetical protein